MGRFLVASLGCAIASSGCALSMSGLTKHNSLGTECVDHPVFGLIDLAIAGLTVAAIEKRDASPGWYVMAGVVGASGIIGTISAFRCRGEARVTGVRSPPPTNAAPSFGDAPVDPDARNATREDMGLPAIDPATPSPTLQLDRDGLSRTPPPPPEPAPEPVTPPAAAKELTCTLTPRVDCPDGYYCKLVAENTGVCETIR